MAYYKHRFHKPGFFERLRQRDQLAARLERMAREIAERSSPPPPSNSAARSQQDWGFDVFFQRAGEESLADEGPKAA